MYFSYGSWWVYSLDGIHLSWVSSDSLTVHYMLRNFTDLVENWHLLVGVEGHSCSLESLEDTLQVLIMLILCLAMNKYIVDQTYNSRGVLPGSLTYVTGSVRGLT